MLRKFLVRLGIERPIVFGHSFGAMVAVAFALAYPAAARSLVLASGYYFPSGRLDVPLMTPPALPVIGDLMRHTVSPLLGRLLWPGLLKLLFSPGRSRAISSAPSAIQLQRLYRALETPAIMVAGAQDRFVDHRRHSVALSRMIPRSELMLAPRAGHMVHHVDPRRVLQAIEMAAR